MCNACTHTYLHGWVEEVAFGLLFSHRCVNGVIRHVEEDEEESEEVDKHP